MPSSSPRRTNGLLPERQRFKLSIGDLERICNLMFGRIIVLHLLVLADGCSLVENLEGNLLGVEGEEETRSCGIVPFGGH